MGDKTTGGAVYWMDDGADTGDIAAQDWCWVNPGDTPESLWRDQLAPMGLRLMSTALTGLNYGLAPKTPKNPALATWKPSFTKIQLKGA